MKCETCQVEIAKSGFVVLERWERRYYHSNGAWCVKGAESTLSAACGNCGAALKQTPLEILEG